MPGLKAGEYDVSLNGLRLHYTVRGSGPVILAHSGGPGLDARYWDDFAGIDDFATLVVIHPRGTGLSSPPADDSYLLSDYAADLEALRMHLGLEKPILMGWSHGGMVAQQYAFTYPDALSKLILYATSAHFGEFFADLESAVQPYKDQPWFEESLAALKAESAGQFSTEQELRQLLVRELKFYFRQYDARADAYNRRLADLPINLVPLKIFNETQATSMDLRPHLKEIKVPVLVLVGRHDFITNLDMAQEMTGLLSQARLEVFEDSGHFIFIEEPGKFHRVIKQFLEG